MTGIFWAQWISPIRHALGMVAICAQTRRPDSSGVDVKGSFVSNVIELTAADINALIMMSLFAVQSSPSQMRRTSIY
jgi:hypothetical protein